jgi:hypothetical protein
MQLADVGYINLHFFDGEVGKVARLHVHRLCRRCNWIGKSGEAGYRESG